MKDFICKKVKCVIFKYEKNVFFTTFKRHHFHILRIIFKYAHKRLKKKQLYIQIQSSTKLSIDINQYHCVPCITVHDFPSLYFWFSITKSYGFFFRKYILSHNVKRKIWNTDMLKLNYLKLPFYFIIMKSKN